MMARRFSGDLRRVGRLPAAGYAMAGLLVILACMAVLAMVAMPVWRTMEQREREEELIFRGRQYTRAIGLFQRKFANAYPPSVDVLVDQKFLRKKYKDPVNRDADFTPITQGQLAQLLAKLGQTTASGPGATAPGTSTPQTGAPGGLTGASPTRGPSGTAPSGAVQAGGFGTTAGPAGGVVGVVSKSTATSIRQYNGRTAYNEWLFVYTQQQGQGRGGGGRGGGGVTPGGQGQMPGQPMGGRGGRGFQGGFQGGAAGQRGGPGPGL
jgi:type II secretory pathway pseudopilin PulG